MKNTLFACLLLLAFFAHAQTATVSFSNKFEFKDRGMTDNTSTTLHLGDYYYTMATDYKESQFAPSPRLSKIKYAINLGKYTAEMKEAGKISLNNGKKDFGPFPPQAILFNNKLLLFYYTVQPDGSIKLLEADVDPQTFTAGAARNIYTMSQADVGANKTDEVVGRNKLLLVTSPDKKQLMVVQAGNTSEIFTCIINSNGDVVKPLTTQIKDSVPDFAVQNVFVSNDGNKCISYTYTLNKLNQRGVLVQNSQGKTAFLDFNTGYKEWGANKLAFFMSPDNATLNVYANYYGDYLDEGVLLTTLDAVQLKYGSVKLFPYSEDLKEKMTRLGFGTKQKDNYTVRRIDYTCIPLADGTLALTGFPTSSSSTETTYGFSNMQQSSYSVTTTAGPLVNVFLKEGQCKFAVLNRVQTNSLVTGYIPVAYKDKLVCIYCDSKNNLQSGTDNKIKTSNKSTDIVLVEAVIGSDGTMISRNVINDSLPNSDDFYIDYNKQLSATSYVIPVARQKLSGGKYISEVSQWATVSIQ